MNEATRSQGALTRLLREIHVGRKSGALRAERGDEHHLLRFVQGQVVSVESSLPTLRLPQLLQTAGLISADAAKAIEEAATREQTPLVRAVQEHSKVDKARLDEVRAGQLRSVVQRVAEWTDTEYVFETDDGIGKAEPVAGITTGDLVLLAVAGIKDPNVARYALGNLDRVVVPTTDPLLRFQKVTLKQLDGYLLSRIDGTLSARQVAQLMPASVEEVIQSLFALHCAGLIEFLDVRVPQARAQPSAPLPLVVRGPEPSPTPAPAPATAKPPEPPRDRVQVPAATVPVAPATAAGAPVAAPKKELEGDARRYQDILDFHRDLKSKNHFEILGLTRSATEAQVREAYFQLAKRYHPDVHRGPLFADVNDKIEAILVRLGEAFETLKDPARRGNYESLLASREPRPPATGDGPATAVSGPATPGNSQIETRIAEDAVRKAEKLYLTEQFWDAIQAVEPQVGKTQGKMRVRARLVLAKCYCKNPNWVKRAEEQLNHLLEDDPKHVEAHFLLGTIYLGGGLRSRALSKFRRVLELNPEHEEARARVNELEPPPDATPAPSGGFIKRIFGRTTDE